MKINIEESGVIFGSFNKDKIFEIEEQLKTLPRGDDFRKVEFILEAEEKLIFLEAKSSIPRERKEFYGQIKEKFIDSMLLFIGGVTNRNQEINKLLNENMKRTEILDKKWKFLLVIPNIPNGYLVSMQDEVRKFVFSKEMKALGVKKEDILVLNEEKCRRIKLIK